LNDLNVKTSKNSSLTWKSGWLCIKLKSKDLTRFLRGWFDWIIFLTKGLIKFIN
jgi:hypothetical protein